MANNFGRVSTILFIFFCFPGLAGCSAAGWTPDNRRWTPTPDNRYLKAHCIEAEGEWSYGSHLLDDVALKQGEVVQYDVKISCWGRYQFFVSVYPDKETVSVVAGSDRRNAYVETVYLADGTTRERYLKPHNITYSITMSSLTNVERVIKIEKPWAIPTFPASLPGKLIRIPWDFRKGERFRINISIDADTAFYEDYKWIGAVIRIPLH